MWLSAYEKKAAQHNKVLNLSQQELKGLLSPEIGELTTLQFLYLGGNQLTTLPPEIGQLTNLEMLDLRGNQLTTLPPEIGQLTNLQFLYLGGNQLATLPPEIGQLTNLEMLDLRGNQLTAVPRHFAALLRSGLSIALQGNPLLDPIPELIARGTDALATYLGSLEDAIVQYEAKVLVVGEGNVGKTSLIAALLDEPFIEARPTTHGIEIQPLVLCHPDLNVDMTVRAWDFGGQEVYRITHQFFFSNQALYLVVWNAREGQEQDGIEGWLRRIRLRVGNNASVLIVATHCDERHPELDYSRLERTFPGLLAGQYEIDNRSGAGINRLRLAMAAEAAKLPQMGQLISPRWAAARAQITSLAEANPQIPYSEFTDICRNHGVGDDESLTLAQLMHDLGQIVYYGDDFGLCDFIILNPDWLTRAISYVLEDDSTIQSGGVLEHGRLAQIWGNRTHGASYATQYHPYFLRLMEKFDVSYRLDEQHSLVAQLVPYSRPSLPWDIAAPIPEGVCAVVLICQLAEPAPGLISWLTVRHRNESTGCHWRSGVFLRHPIPAYESEALIELKAPDQIVVSVRAPFPEFYFNTLRDSIEHLIVTRWPGMAYRLLIPCPTRGPDGSPCTGQFPLQFLLGYSRQGGTRALCQDCLVDHDLSLLLRGFA
jgi:internalin A